GGTTSSHDCLADVLKHARSVLALNARISQRLSSLQIRLIVQRRVRRHPPQVFHDRSGILSRPVKTRQNLLRVLPRHSILKPADKGSTHSRTSSGRTNNSTSLQCFTGC